MDIMASFLVSDPRPKRPITVAIRNTPAPPAPYGSHARYMIYPKYIRPATMNWATSNNAIHPGYPIFGSHTKNRVNRLMEKAIKKTAIPSLPLGDVSTMVSSIVRYFPPIPISTHPGSSKSSFTELDHGRVRIQLGSKKNLSLL